MEMRLYGVQSFNNDRTGSLLHKFLEQMRALQSMPVGMVQHLLRADEVGQVLYVKTLVTEDGEAVVRRLQDVRYMEG
jgi:hypothetical protein